MKKVILFFIIVIGIAYTNAQVLQHANSSIFKSKKSLFAKLNKSNNESFKEVEIKVVKNNLSLDGLKSNLLPKLELIPGNKNKTKTQYNDIINKINALSQQIHKSTTEEESLKMKNERTELIKAMPKKISKESYGGILKDNEAKIKKYENTIQAEPVIKTDKYQWLKVEYDYIKNNYDLNVQNISFKLEEFKKQYTSIKDNIDSVNELFNSIPNNKDVVRGIRIIDGVFNESNALQSHISRTEEVFTHFQTLAKRFEQSLTTFIKVTDSSNYEGYNTKEMLPLISSTDDTLFFCIKNFNNCVKELDALKLHVNEEAEKVNAIIDKYKPVKEVKTSDFALFGAFQKMLNNNGSLIPSLKVLGSTKFGDANKIGNAFGNIKLFIGGSGNDTINTAYNFFVQEASTYGLIVDIGFGFSYLNSEEKKSKKLDPDEKATAFLFNFSYLSKHLAPNSSNTIDPSALHWKFGIEQNVFKNALSIHTNLNGMFIATQYDKVQSFYKLANDVNWFWDAGLSTQLKLDEDNKFNLNLQLNFIFPTPTMRNFINTKDKTIPQFKIELARSL